MSCVSPDQCTDWRVLKKKPSNWVITELAEMFLAYSVSNLDEVHHITYAAEDAGKALWWLKQAAKADREEATIKCKNCEHRIHKKVATRPYCSKECRAFVKSLKSG